MNGHIIATTLGQMTGLIIALAIFLPLVLLFFGVFKFLLRLVWAIISLPFKILFSLLKQQKKSKEITSHEEQEQPAIQQGVIETPEYIGLLTKIDKEKIAKDYLAEQRRKKHGRRK